MAGIGRSWAPGRAPGLGWSRQQPLASSLQRSVDACDVFVVPALHAFVDDDWRTRPWSEWCLQVLQCLQLVSSVSFHLGAAAVLRWDCLLGLQVSTVASPWAVARPSFSVPRKLGRRPPNGEYSFYFFTFLVQRATDRQKYTPRSAHTRTPGRTRRTNQRRTGITSSLLFPPS